MPFLKFEFRRYFLRRFEGAKIANVKVVMRVIFALAAVVVVSHINFSAYAACVRFSVGLAFYDTEDFTFL